MWNYTKTLFFQYLRMPYTYISFILPIIFIVGLGRIIPAGMVIPAALTIGITITILFLFGGTLQELRTTSLIKSISLTRLSKTMVVLINMFVASVITIILVGMILLFSFGLDQTAYLADDFSAFSDSQDGILSYLNATIVWRDIEWFTFFYAIVVTVCLSFSIAFLIIAFTKTTNSLYVISFFYIFLLLLVGSIVIPKLLTMITDSFVQYLNVWIPHYYSNQLLISSMVIDNVVLGEFINNSPHGDQIQQVLSFVSQNVEPFDDWNWGAINTDVNQYNSLVMQWINGDFENNKEFYEWMNNPENWNSDLFIILTNPINNSAWYDKVMEDISSIKHPKMIAVKNFLRLNRNNSLLTIFIKYGDFVLDTENSFATAMFLGNIFDLFNQNHDVIIRYRRSISSWDFHSLSSMANSFLPVAISSAFVIIGVKRFRWSI